MKLAERLKQAEVSCFQVPEVWHTPASDYKLGRVGHAELQRIPYVRGVYVMEGVDGFPLYQVNTPIQVTSLSIYGNQWMVDDPLHWIGMQRIAETCKGNVLVVGLGLGLVVHALGANQCVTHVTVLERDRDVIKLMSPKLVGVSGGTDDRYWLEIRERDFWTEPDYSGYDVIVWDILTSSEHSRQAQMFILAAAMNKLKEAGHKGKTFVWGTRDPKLNPSIKPMNERSRKYMMSLVEAM